MIRVLQAWMASRTESERGATMVEYGLLLALIAVVVAVAATLLGTSIATLFNVRSRQAVAPQLLERPGPFKRSGAFENLGIAYSQNRGQRTEAMKYHYDGLRPPSTTRQSMADESANGVPGWRERGAALVEFAIILPILLTLVFGIIEFGRGYDVKVQLTGGVREGAGRWRSARRQRQAKQAVIDAAPGLDLSGATFTNTACPAGGADGNATVKSPTASRSLTPLVPSGSINLTATGVMRCGL